MPVHSLCRRQIVRPSNSAAHTSAHAWRSPTASAPSSGSTPRAREHLERANGLFRSPRLSLVCVLLRLFPGVLLKVYRLRDRLIVGADTSF